MFRLFLSGLAILAFLVLLAAFIFLNKHFALTLLSPFLGKIAEETRQGGQGADFRALRADLWIVAGPQHRRQPALHRPGTSDAVDFVGDPNAEADSDGLTALVEHALGASDSSSNAGPLGSLDGSGHFVFQSSRNLVADDVVVELQMSEDLVNWTTVTNEFEVTGETLFNDGTSLVTQRSVLPQTTRTQFLRLRVAPR